ncbi:tRNA dimethylallyltransferase [Acidaminococcus intestini]|nr:tRNA dimethylallyltransferase [Acidaminococcus intestini]
MRDPEEKYSAFDFKREAASLIQEIHGRGHMPIIVGGQDFILRPFLKTTIFQPAKNKPSDVRPLQNMPIAMAMRPSIKNWKNLMKKRRID